MPLIRKPPTDPPQAAPPPAPADFEAVRASLYAREADDRWRAARALSAFPEAATVLGAAATAEADTRVREAMFTSLARIGSPDSVAALALHVRSDDAGRRTGAMDALKAMPQALEGGLTALLKDPDSDVRVLACDLARALPSTAATSLLSGVLDTDPEVNVCAAAVDVLADVGSPEAVPALKRCAARFTDQPFLTFAIRVACDRIGASGLGS
jgi:HEAT repeat protein